MSEFEFLCEGNISEPEPGVSLEETKAKRVKRAAYRSEWLSKKSPKYLDTLRQKARERYFRRKEKMTAEQWANKQARQKFARIEKAVQMTEEERERQRLEDYVKRQAYKAKFTKEEWAEKLTRQRERNKKIYYKKSLDERRKGFAKYREYIRNLPEDKLKKHKENNTKSCRKYMQKLKRENPEKYRMYTVEAFKKNWDKFLESQRKRVESETLEMREKRLLRCRINLAKKRTRKKLEEDGILSIEEIEKRLMQVEEEVRNKPRKSSEYKPRLKARKPHNVSNTVTINDNAPAKEAVEETVQEESSIVEMSQSPIPPQQSFQPSSFEVIIPSISYQRVEVIPSQLYVELPLCPPVQIEGSDRFQSEPVRFEIVIPTNEDSQSEIQFMNEEESNAPVTVLSPPPVVAKPDNLEPEQPLVKVNVFRQTSLTEDKQPITNNFASSSDTQVCDECGEPLKDKRHLVIHKNTVHNAPSDLTCSKCTHTATSSRALWHHFVTFHCDLGTTSGLPPIHTNSRSARTPSEKRKKDARYQDTPNICSECGKQFKQKCTLDDHVRRVHEGKVHSCSECGVDCQSVVKLWRHQVERHNKRDLPPPEGIEAVLCRYCGEIIMRGYEAHVRKKHPESLAEFQQSGDNVKLPGSKGKKSKFVDVEGENVKSRALDINVDLRERRKQPRFENCSYCSKSIRQDLIARHIREHHKKILNCPDCGKHFGEVYKLHEHYREVHAFEQFEKVLLERNMITTPNPNTRAAVCLLCGNLELTEKFSVRSHFISAHIELFEKLNDEMKPTFPCEFCPDVIYSKEMELRTHFQECHPDKSLYCKICGRFRITQAKLATHMAHHKSRAQRNRKICFICQLDLTSKHDGSQNSDDHLRSHVKTVHSEYFFPCLEPNCSTFLYSNEALAAHSTHEEHKAGETMQDYLDNIFGRKKFKCDHCDKFLMLKNWETHRRKMHGLEEATFKCPECSLEFMFFDCLLAHKHIIHKIPVQDIMNLEETKTISGKIPMKNARQLKINSGLAKKTKSGNKRKRPGNGENLSASIVEESFNPEIRELRRKTILKRPRRRTKLEEQEENEEQRNYLNKCTKTRKHKPSGTRRTRAFQLQSECAFISEQSEKSCDGEMEEVKCEPVEVKREPEEVLELHKRLLVRVVRLTEKEIQSYKNTHIS